MEAQIPDVDGVVNFTNQYQEQLHSTAGLICEGDLPGTYGQFQSKYFFWA
jgi:hypothetical protein